MFYKIHPGQEDLLKSIESELDPVTDEWIQRRLAFQKERENELSIEFQTRLESLVPNTYLVYNQDSSVDHSINLLLQGGLVRFWTKDDIILKKHDLSVTMYRNRCHENCDNLLAEDEIDKYFSGFTLSDDRLWRYHSWTVSFEDKIMETTCKRLIYLTNEVIEEPKTYGSKIF
jgi:hypothetical protein